MRRTVLLASGAAAVAASLVLAPAAASAAPVPYIYTWEAGELLEYTDPLGGEGEVVPTTTPAFAITGLDVDGDGFGYAVNWDGISHLYSVDVLTGVVEDLGPLLHEGAEIEDCTGLDYSGGVLRVACDDVPEISGESTYLTVDVETLETSVIATSDVRVASIAVHPDGSLYGFGYDEEIVEVVDGTATVVGDAGATLWGADFASDGTLWATVDDPEAAPATVGDWAFVAAALDLANDDIAENLTVYEAAEPVVPVVPTGPVLPATGADTAPVLLGAVALIAVGAGIAVAATLRRRTV